MTMHAVYDNKERKLSTGDPENMLLIFLLP